MRGSTKPARVNAPLVARSSPGTRSTSSVPSNRHAEPVGPTASWLGQLAPSQIGAGPSAALRGAAPPAHSSWKTGPGGAAPTHPSTAEHVAGASHASGRASATQVPPTQRASAQLATGAQSASAAHSGGGHEASVPSTHSRLPQSPRMQVSVISSQVTPAQLRGITTVRIRGPSWRKTIVRVAIDSPPRVTVTERR